MLKRYNVSDLRSVTREVFRRVHFPLAPSSPQWDALYAVASNDHAAFISVDDDAESISHGLALVQRVHQVNGLHALCVTARNDYAHLMTLQGAAARAPLTVPKVCKTVSDVERVVFDEAIRRPHLLITDVDGFMRIKERISLQSCFSFMMLDHVEQWVRDDGVAQELKEIRSSIASLYRLRVLGCGIRMSDVDLWRVNRFFNPAIAA